MEQRRILTTDEVVQMAKEKLMNISVPAGLSRAIGLPINEAIEMLQEVQNAWARDEEESRMKMAHGGNAPEKLFPEDTADNSEPEIEVVAEPVEEAEEDADHGE